jgi:hypothetical protein
MQVPHTHTHYALSSVGALMDPGFLRGAVLDAESEHHHDRAAASSSILACLRRGLRTAASILSLRRGRTTEVSRRSGD